MLEKNVEKYPNVKRNVDLDRKNLLDIEARVRLHKFCV